ncbi:MAG: hypothetical protein EHM33_00430 [Chloroflexi bacterium]|nr:MAG: hypothetical protein EHM33_00430 [Chloroflexota bacterium]
MILDDLAYRRCKAIKDMLDGPLFNSAIEEVKDNIRDDIMNSKPEQSELRESLYSESKALERVLGRLAVYAGNYTMMTEGQRHG